MISQILDDGPKFSIQLFGDYDIPSWTLVHYCHQTISNSVKFSTIMNMLKLLENGIEWSDFAIEIKPKELYPELETLLREAESVIRYADVNDRLESSLIRIIPKEQSTADFWRLLRKQDRPNVLVREENGWVPIYDTRQRLAVKLKSLQVNSPPSIGFEGLGTTINDLRYGKEREIRTNIDWQNHQVGVALDNLNRLINTAERLNDARIPPGPKAYLVEIYRDLLGKQADINHKVGIGSADIRQVEA